MSSYGNKLNPLQKTKREPLGTKGIRQKRSNN